MTPELQTKVAVKDGELHPTVRQYLEATGWLTSFESGEIVDRKGKAVPWYTYAAIDFLTKRTAPDMTVFEYGCGNSTIWWARRVKSVAAVEHDAAWANRVRPTLRGNASLRLIPLVEGGDYSRASLDAGVGYDIIVIDGRDRVNCAKYAINALSGHGVIIWDNSERSYYKDGQDHLSENGFRRVDFVSNGPKNPLPWQTTIFYRNGNRFGL